MCCLANRFRLDVIFVRLNCSFYFSKIKLNSFFLNQSGFIDFFSIVQSLIATRYAIFKVGTIENIIRYDVIFKL